MTLSDANAWLVIIPALAAAVVSIINVIKSRDNGHKLAVADKKLDVIHELTNSNLSAVKADLEIARKDITFLKEWISKNTTPPDPDAPQPEFIAKIELAPPPDGPTSAIP